jgi:hypothetical protein
MNAKTALGSAVLGLPFQTLYPRPDTRHPTPIPGKLPSRPENQIANATNEISSNPSVFSRLDT